MNLIPSHFEQKLLQYLKLQYLPQRFQKSTKAHFTNKDLMFFAQGAALLSNAFTVERGNMPQNYFNKKEFRSAYLLYFTLTNFAKIFKCLAEANLNGRVNKILDLGSGPGTACLACSYFFNNSPIQLTALDQNAGILEDAQQLFKQLGNPKHIFRTKQQTISDQTRINERFDLIIAANVLNELKTSKQQYRLCQNLLEHNLNPDGCLIILDPALQKTTRPLMELRDQILQNLTGYQIVNPCLHQGNCPMLTHNKRDWCHFYLEWKCPDIIRRVDQLLGIKHDYLKMAYLIIKKTNDERRTTSDETKWRVVSSPLFSKGKIELILCANKRLRKIMRLDRDTSSANSCLANIKRGDIITISTKHDRIEKDTQIKIINHFNS
ncbi:MAG: small ribosomal subunit Rsm22 family protein [Pseudomonadota bacterium]